MQVFRIGLLGVIRTLIISELSLDLARRHVFSCTVSKATNILGTLRNYDNDDAVNEKYEFAFMRLIPIIINSFRVQNVLKVPRS